MSTVAYTDHHTHELLDDALEQLARHRDLNLTSGTGLLSGLASLRQQIDHMIEQAIAESDIGYDVTIEDIADALGITDTQARHRYTATDNHPF